MNRKERTLRERTWTCRWKERMKESLKDPWQWRGGDSRWKKKAKSLLGKSLNMILIDDTWSWMCITMKKGMQVWTYNNYKKTLKSLHYVPLLKDFFFMKALLVSNTIWVM